MNLKFITNTRKLLYEYFSDIYNAFKLDAAQTR